MTSGAPESTTIASLPQSAVSCLGLIRFIMWRQHVLRVDQAFGGMHLEVEVLAVCVAGVAAIAEQLALAHDLAFLDEDLEQVRVQGLHAAAVVDHDVVTVILIVLTAGEVTTPRAEARIGESSS